MHYFESQNSPMGSRLDIERGSTLLDSQLVLVASGQFCNALPFVLSMFETCCGFGICLDTFWVCS